MLLCICASHAQVQDSVLLDEVAVHGRAFHRFATGASVQSISIREADHDLAAALTGLPSIYFKNYGNGQLTTISFRGSSANQTNVLWHGIPANYPTLGLMDFSQWPLWMLESIDLQAGNAGALYGSGSIGGTVLLDSEIPAIDENMLEVRSEIGSYAYYLFGVKTAYAKGRLSGQTKIYRSNLENNFPYYYNGKHLKQQNASSRHFGFQQQLKLAAGSHQLLFDGTVSRNDREIQPSKEMRISSNSLETENLRMAVVHQYEMPNTSLSNTIAFLGNSTLFNQFRTTSRQYSAQSMLYKELVTWLNVRIGSNINYFTVHSDNYNGITKDTQAALFASVEVKPSSWWKITTNLRQSFYKTSTPFTPSVGSEIIVLNTDRLNITLLNQIAFGYRYPSLNERFWSPGGNPDLLPETSFGFEGGLKTIYFMDHLQSTTLINVYRTYSKNWIYWTQSVHATPKNLGSALLTGMEISQRLETKSAQVKWQLETNYSLNFSINQTEPNKGNQLIYSPLHSGGLRMSSTYKGWSANINGSHTGLRYQKPENTPRSILDAFTLIDFGLAKEIKLGMLQTKVGAQIKNLTDQDYENLPNLAMPGRNYQFNLSIKI